MPATPASDFSTLPFLEPALPPSAAPAWDWLVIISMMPSPTTGPFFAIRTSLYADALIPFMVFSIATCACLNLISPDWYKSRILL